MRRVAFVAEVKGRPRPFGLVVARVDDVVLWPRGRSLSAVSKAALTAETAEPPRPELTVLDAGHVHATPWQRSRVPLLGLAAAACLGVFVSAKALVGRNDAGQLERDGVEVVATITEADADDYTLGVEFRLPGAEDRRKARVPVAFPEDWNVGDRFPAVVDPTDPDRIRFLAEPYDALEPQVWGWTPAAAAALWLAWSARWRRLEGKVTGGPWREVDTRVIGRGFAASSGAEVVQVEVAYPDHHPSCIIRVPVEEAHRWPTSGLIGSTQRMALSGTPSPGEATALRSGDIVLPAIGAARAPQTTALSGLIASRAGLGPTPTGRG